MQREGRAHEVMTTNHVVLLGYSEREGSTQIAHLHGQLRADRIAPVTDTVHDTNTLVTLPNSPSHPR